MSNIVDWLQDSNDPRSGLPGLAPRWRRGLEHMGTAALAVGLALLILFLLAFALGAAGSLVTKP